MFQFPASLCFSARFATRCRIRRSWVQSLHAAHPGLSQLATSFITTQAKLSFSEPWKSDYLSRYKLLSPHFCGKHCLPPRFIEHYVSAWYAKLMAHHADFSFHLWQDILTHLWVSHKWIWFRKDYFWHLSIITNESNWNLLAWLWTQRESNSCPLIANQVYYHYTMSP